MQADGVTLTPARGRELVLVTDASIVLKTAANQALVYFADSFDGSPIADAEVSVWERIRADGDWDWRQLKSRTGDDGIATFRLRRTGNNVDLFVAAARDDRAAFSTGSNYRQRRDRDRWRIYAFTDRAAYRPGEQASWKLIVRRHDGRMYSTPAEQTLWIEIYDPRNSKIDERQVSLNAFGSAWGELELGEAMPLGEYRVRFRERSNGRNIGEATLLRLEEYKLPEFKVAIATPLDDDGKRKAYQLGETVEAEIRAEYYFGGAVADATVEVLVYQKPFYHHWRPRRDYGWYYDDIDPRASWYGGGQVIKRELLSADPDGTVSVRFETPAGGGQDFEYRIEARVTDASRREIVASDSVRVTRQRTYVYARPRHHLHRPLDQIEIDFQALDANQQPRRVSGVVKVNRNSWHEIWVDDVGNELSGEPLETLRRTHRTFPRVGERVWRQKSSGYEQEEVLSRALTTDAEGEAVFAFTPQRDGYYTVAFSGQETDGAPISTQTAVWVATNQTTELGYRHGGLEIIVDKDTFRVGNKAAVMLTVPTNDRYVLFSIEGEDLYSYQLVHLSGTVKLLEVELAERHVPNIYLAGAMVAENQIHTDIEQVVVPPTRHFLDVEVLSDRLQYKPGEEGELTVRVRDHEGRPVAAEVGLSLVDEATFYIQDEYAADPRQYFFGDKRAYMVRTISSFQHKRYTDLIESDAGDLIDRDQLHVEGAVGQDERYDRYAGLESGLLRNAAKSSVADAVGGRYRSSERALMANEEMPAAPRQASEAEGLATGAEQPAVQVRSDFRSTALWQPAVVTGADGDATVKVTYPDSLTSWRATARVATSTSQFGTEAAATRTQKPLIVRLQAPRFFVVSDHATISAVINNNTDAAMTVVPELAADGLSVSGAGGGGNDLGGAAVRVEPGSDTRVDWAVEVTQPGPVRLAVTARSESESDGMERSFLAHDHGIEKLVATAGKLRGDDVNALLQLPAARRQSSTHMTVQITPSIAIHDARCAALSNRLPVRLHRADDEPFLAHRHYRRYPRKPRSGSRRSDGAGLRRHREGPHRQHPTAGPA